MLLCVPPPPHAMRAMFGRKPSLKFVPGGLGCVWYDVLTLFSNRAHSRLGGKLLEIRVVKFPSPQKMGRRFYGSTRVGLSVTTQTLNIMIVCTSILNPNSHYIFGTVVWVRKRADQARRNLLGRLTLLTGSDCTSADRESS